MLKRHYNVTRRLLLVLTALFLSIGVVLCFAFRDKSEDVWAETPIIVSDEIQDKYAVDSFAEFPLSAYVAYQKETTIPAEFLGVRLPDGSVFAYNSVELSTNGIYQVLYSFNYEDETLIAEKDVTVLSQIYEPFSGSSSVSYGSLSKLGGEGINLTLSAGDVFTFNKPVNVYETDLVNIITMYPEMVETYNRYASGDTTVAGADCLDFMISLTDAYDPTNVVAIKMGFRQNKSGGVIAMVVSEHGRVSMVEYMPTYEGTHSKQYGQLTIGNKNYYIWRAAQLTDEQNRYGFAAGSYAREGFTWAFGGKTNQVIIANAKDFDSPRIIEDLDNQDITTVTGKFRPFTTGEVYVSVYAERWQASSTKIQIKAIGNYTEKELVGDYVIDDVKPVVNVDFDDQGNEGIVGIVYNSINLFDVQAFDLNGTSVKKQVYYNYGTDKQSSIAINNNSFTPTVPGDYAIVYTATDYYGNTEAKVIPVKVIKPDGAKSTSGDGIDILNIESIKLSSQTIGEEAELVEPEFLGYNGDISCYKSVYAPDGTSVRLTNDTFYVNQLGKYTVKYTYYDNVYRFSYSYNFDSVASSNAFFSEDANFDKYFIARATYKLDDYYASYVQNGAIKTAVAELQVKYGREDDYGVIVYDTDFIDVDYQNFIPEVADRVILRYKYGDVFSKEYKKTVVDVNYGVYHTSGASLFMPERYFYGDFTSASASTAQRFTSNTTSGNNTLEFIRPILTDDFSFTFKTPESLMNYDKVLFTLTDVNDDSNTFTFTQYYETWHNYVQFEDEPRIDATIIVQGKSHEEFENETDKRISFSASSNKFTYYNSKTTYDFFTDREVPRFAYFSIEFVGINGEAGIDALKIGTDDFITDADKSKPKYVLNASSGYYNYGSDVVLKAPMVTDLFSPVSVKDVKVTVTDADGKYVVSKDGKTLRNQPGYIDYTIVAISDSYKVVYDGLKDGYNNKSSTNYMFYVADFEKPVLSFNDGSNEDTVVSASVGKKIRIKDFTVTDNKSAADKLQVVITVVNLNYYNWVAKVDPATMEVEIKRAGKYLVKVSARDEAGNFQVISYQLNVD